MDEILNTLPVIWKMILGLCAMIAAVGGAVAIIVKVFTPIKDIKNRLATLEQLHKFDQKNNDDKFKQDIKEIEKLEKANHHICQCMLALMDHEITGNSIERLKNARDELHLFLIEK